ncbi:DUF6602 domain-containing protein [Microbacterium sp. NPDC028030]|uniref:DUF6602 domain-containing protein n=1 Tax=Microbacterium sp. NPDC028030 TaxID=3155124 RepID=UPI0033E695CE
MHHEKLLEWADNAKRSHAKAFEGARTDPQHAGHIAEQTWVAFLKEWLPPSYEVVMRKYIVPEIGDKLFETDIVILRPSYPPALRDDPNIMASGVAAAFSVKSTLKPQGIREAVDSAITLRRSMHVRKGSPRRELHGAYPYGLLSLSHAWQADPLSVLKTHVEAAQASVSHPRELLDFICVPDLACVTAGRVAWVPGEAMSAMSDGAVNMPVASAGYAFSNPEESIAPVASFIAGLITKLAYHDPALQPLADGFRLTGTQGVGEGMLRRWPLEGIYSAEVLKKLPYRMFSDDEWRPEYH